MKLFAGILVALAILLTGVWYVDRDNGSVETAESLTVYCAAGIKKPVAAIAEAYRKEYGVEINLQYGGTGTLLSQIRVAKKGDIFIAADDGSVAAAKSFELIREVLPLAIQYPVIAVPKGNPKNIRTLEDLMDPNFKVAVANPEAASVGKVTKRALGKDWDALAKKVVVMKPTVTELATDITIGSIDAAVIWNSTVPQFEGLEAIKADPFTADVEHVSAAILSFSESPSSALRFARYLSAPEKGGATFTEKGFDTVQGDRWKPKPEMILYSGGVNRPAVEGLLKEFAEREGITITTVFNGCGVLCATMETMGDASDPKFPDAYYACDLCFVPPVEEHFSEVAMLTETSIGIAVQKGNPKGVKTLADLAAPELRVGLCNAKQSTLGYMTDGMLTSSGLNESVRKNADVEVPTADFLINQLRTGALDAAIVYEVNFQLQKDHLEFIAINHEGAKAVQPYSVREDSPNRQLGKRLLQHFLANRERFETAGFQWVGDSSLKATKDIKIPTWLKPEETE